MEKTKESIERALNLLNIQREKKKIILKEEQEKAVVESLSGKNVLATLPTGFGKSLIYTIFALASTDLRSFFSLGLRSGEETEVGRRRLNLSDPSLVFDGESCCSMC